MRFSVRHNTLYSYSAPVQLAGHVLRLHPREADGAVLHENLLIEPSPLSQSLVSDRNGNRATRLEFAGATDRLSIESSFELETAPPRPIIQPPMPLPWRLDDDN